MRVILPLLVGAALACQTNYSPCNPPGATAALPAAGTALASLYPSLLIEVKDLKPPPEPTGVAQLEIHDREDSQFCCIDGTDCRKLSGFNAPFCYDRFTTNYVFSDGSTGNLAQGILNLVNGPKIDLIHGGYEGGNIYGTNAPPNTATLPLPTPYTASGVGSAIPLTSLGGVATMTSTAQGSTVTGTSQPGSSSVSVIVESGTTKTVIPTASGVSSSTSSAAAPIGRGYGADAGSKIAWCLFAALVA